MRALALGIAIAVVAAGAPAAPGGPAPARQRGIRENAPWVSFYGTARQMGLEVVD